MLKKISFRIIFIGLIAFFLYGSWAFYINSDFGHAVALRSGIAQGMLSFSVTTMMSYAMEFFYNRIAWRWCRFVITAYFPLICVLYFMAFVHFLIGTPNIIETITPSMVIGTLYCTSYTIGLSRLSKRIIAVRIVAFLCVMALVLRVGLMALKHETQPKTNGIVYVAGLHGPVFIERDKNGVPHILAKNSDNDAFFALGFVHAQDRLWQMEFQNHVVKGTLSTLFGKSTIKQDEYLRTWGFYRAAKKVWPTLNHQTHAIIESYTAGVNAQIQQGRFSLPFLLLGYRPIHWTVYDSIAWQKMMAWELQFTWQEKIKNYLIAKQFGAKKIPYYLPPYPTSAPTTLNSAEVGALMKNDTPQLSENTEQDEHNNTVPTKSENNAASDSTISALLGPLQFPGKGSNAWVVSGKLTQSGKPLLANDIHLPLSAPDPFYLVSLTGPTMTVVGASIPGLPAVVIGHNSHIAWGMTDGYNDAQDLFIIPQHAKLTVRDEIIDVKNGKPVHFQVLISDHGPVISDVVPEMQHLPFQLALQWPALEAHDTTVQSFVKLQYAKNWTDFVNAMRDFVSPTQNFVYADTHGNIGFYYPGKLPIRNKFTGAMPVNSDQTWNGFIPFDQLPHVYNPKAGFIATANNKVVPDNYPYVINARWRVPPYRVERIRYLLTHSGKITEATCETIQKDVVSYFWDDLKSILLQTKPLDLASKNALVILKNWNGEFGLHNRGATIFAYWLKQFTVLWPHDLAFGDKWLEPLYLKNVLAQPSEASFLSQTLSLAMKALIAAQGVDEKNWEWQKTHAAIFNELGLGKAKMVSWMWEKRLPTPGGDYTVDVGTYDPGYFSQVAGPTYRQVINLGDLNQSDYMIPLGESENVFSPNHENLLLRWKSVQYIHIKPAEKACDPTKPNCLELLPREPR